MPGLVAWGARVIVTFTDFGCTGPYLGQVRLALAREAPGVAVVDLQSDAPAFNPRASAYLLGALAPELPVGAICLAVVDPDVGMAERRPAIVRAFGRYFVGPDNGIFNVVARAAPDRERWEILWRPGRLSATFHARDLFAPVAARLALGDWPAARAVGWHPGDFAGWPQDLGEVVYIDGYGNCMTGLRAGVLPQDARLVAGGRVLDRARTFGDVPRGTAFWYESSNGLAEIAVSGASAAGALGLAIGSPVRVDGLPASGAEGSIG